MTVEQTLVLIKPDAVLMGCAEAIKKRYLDVGLKIVVDYPLHFSMEAASDFYQDHAGKFYFPGLLLALSSGTCRVLLMEGEKAIEVVRDLNGPTNPANAPEGTIRHDFRSAGGPFNTVHGSDSHEAFVHERNVVIWAQRKISE